MALLESSGIPASLSLTLSSPGRGIVLPFASHVEPGARGRTLAAIARRRVPGILIAARTPTVASQAAALAVGADVVTMDELAAADAML